MHWIRINDIQRDGCFVPYFTVFRIGLHVQKIFSRHVIVRGVNCFFVNMSISNIEYVFILAMLNDDWLWDWPLYAYMPGRSSRRQTIMSCRSM